MGGVDKMDHLVALHPCKFKVKRWPMKVFLHLMDLTLCNASLFYVLDHKQTHPGVNVLNYDFKRRVSECWIKQNVGGVKRHVRKHGRLSSEVSNRLRFDQRNHWPHAFSGWNGRVRCVNQKSKKQTNIFCLKCEVPLCCHGTRNCFISYHTEEND